MKLFKMYKKHRKYRIATSVAVSIGLGTLVAAKVISDKKKEKASDKKESEKLFQIGTKAPLLLEEPKNYVEVLPEPNHEDSPNDKLLEFINTATPRDLKQIQGIGNVTAKKIVSQRPIESIYVLKQIPRLPQSLFSKFGLEK